MAGWTGGCFITLEGGEGAGKSTQARRLAERLEGIGREVVRTREPGGSPRAESIRDVILSGAVKPLGPAAEAIMFFAARLDHLEILIRPALARGAVVVCDRFLDSTRAYQGVLGHVEPGLLSGLERVVVGADRPDLTLILDLPPGQGLERAAARRTSAEAPDRFEREGEGFHERLRAAFRTIASSEPGRCRLVDASRPVADVGDAIWSAVLDHFPAFKAAAGAIRP